MQVKSWPVGCRWLHQCRHLPRSSLLPCSKAPHRHRDRPPNRVCYYTLLVYSLRTPSFTSTPSRPRLDGLQANVVCVVHVCIPKACPCRSLSLMPKALTRTRSRNSSPTQLQYNGVWVYACKCASHHSVVSNVLPGPRCFSQWALSLASVSTSESSRAPCKICLQHLWPSYDGPSLLPDRRSSISPRCSLSVTRPSLLVSANRAQD
ncbi:hypothetical protein GGR57DRAFT_135632 [Xylariaceae sp. FL1272]|nr:hypothetical protein GGR57DRAFT_135632 [Xylariaceae sp. FL1272]